MLAKLYRKPEQSAECWCAHDDVREAHRLLVKSKNILRKSEKIEITKLQNRLFDKNLIKI